MSINSENPFAPYELQFSTVERKQVVAEMLRELRKAKGFKQKEIAELLGISPQTYNGYETGRNEPPIELLVRFSYLYELPIDLLVQRDRLHKSDESAMLTITKMDEEIAEVREQLRKSEFADVPQINQIMDMITQLTDAMKVIASKTPPTEAK